MSEHQFNVSQVQAVMNALQRTTRRRTNRGLLLRAGNGQLNSRIADTAVDIIPATRLRDHQHDR